MKIGKASSTMSPALPCYNQSLALCLGVATIAAGLLLWQYCDDLERHMGSQSHNKTKCQLPKIDIWDQVILKAIETEEPLAECADDYPLVEMFWSNTAHNFPSVLQLTERGRQEIPRLYCVYQVVKRMTDDQALDYGKEHEIAAFPIDMPGEFVQVVCRDKTSDKIVYSDIFATIWPAFNGFSKQSNDMDNKWNVMVVGIDSISKPSFIRFLPKTFEWLQAMQGNGVHIFDTFHTVGENTFSNLVPMLTGCKVELSTANEPFYLPHSGSVASWVRGEPFDSYPFVWKDYANAGYVTGYVEDDPPIATFNLLRPGFREQPTHHYGRPLFLAIEAFKNRENTVNPGLTGVNKTTGDWYLKEPRQFCINGRKKFEVLWDYAVEQFISRYANISPTFMLSWVVQLTHDALTTLKQAELPLLNLLQFLIAGDSDNKPWRQNTFVFLVSDHGHRLDKVRLSLLGRIEQRIPFLAVSIPSAFRKKYPKMSRNLGENSKNLVTALDLYSTFKHILHLSSTNDSSDVFVDSGPSGYGKSLFQSISINRSCSEAGIPEWYCICGKDYKELDTESEEAVAATKALATEITRDLQDGISAGFCSTLKINATKSIKRIVEPVTPSFYTDYLIQISMTPGYGIFEAVVRKFRPFGLGWNVFGNIERVNRYGNQSACLPYSLERLRKFCFCV